jgi:hypothetical protein
MTALGGKKSRRRGRRRKGTRSSAARTRVRESAKKRGLKKRPAPDEARARNSGRINLTAKGVLASEPPRDSNPANLIIEFRSRLESVLAALAAEGTPFRLVEGFRTVERQQWLYGSGRPDVKPFGRTGAIVTYKDGTRQLSNHQGNRTPGSGAAADCYPVVGNRITIPAASDPVWRRYADIARGVGLRPGLDFPTLRDAPHVEL